MSNAQASGVITLDATSSTVSIDVTSATANGYLTAAANVTVGGVLTNNVVSQSSSVVRPSITKSFGRAAISVGGLSTLTFTLANGAGNPAQSGINFTDTLP